MTPSMLDAAAVYIRKLKAAESQRDRLMIAIRRVCFAAHAVPGELHIEIYALSQLHDSIVEENE